MARKKTDQKLAKQLGKNIGAFMVTKGFTKHSLAKAVGIAQNSVTYFVDGKGTPSVATLLKIAGALNLSLDHLVPPYRD